MSLSRVIFLGPKGTYSHQAAIQQFGTEANIEYIPTQSIPQCFDELKRNKDIAYSVVPLENSTNGQVVFSYDLLRDKMLQEDANKVGKRVIPDLKVVGEQYVSITHCLLTSASIESLDQLTQYRNIKIYSHPQVWGQVTNFINDLKAKCPDVKFETIDTSSTSGAVVIAKEEENKLCPDDKDTLNLAIASETAAHLNKVNIIQHSINDRLGNTTRFLVLQRQADKQPPLQDESMQVSLLTFTTEQDEPGSLVDVLNILKDHSVNMCSIHSRPYNDPKSPRKWQYVFFAEYTLDKTKTDVDIFYNQIAEKCLQWCLWGTFSRNERYYQ